MSLALVIESIGNLEEAYGFGTKAHEEIMKKAYSGLLKDDILISLTQAADSADNLKRNIEGRHTLNIFDIPGFQDYYHFDNCAFKETTENINNNYRLALSFLNHPSSTPEASSLYFGRLLHPIMDFYAHTNWVEIKSYGFSTPELVDTGTGMWEIMTPYSSNIAREKGVLVAQGEHSFYVNKAVPGEPDIFKGYDRVYKVETGTGTFPLLMSGAVYKQFLSKGETCPDDIELGHWPPTFWWWWPIPLFDRKTSLIGDFKEHGLDDIGNWPWDGAGAFFAEKVGGAIAKSLLSSVLKQKTPEAALNFLQSVIKYGKDIPEEFRKEASKQILESILKREKLKPELPSPPGIIGLWRPDIPGLAKDGPFLLPNFIHEIPIFDGVSENPILGFGVPHHNSAKGHAINQIKHEICRIISLERTEAGTTGVKKLIDDWFIKGQSGKLDYLLESNYQDQVNGHYCKFHKPIAQAGPKDPKAFLSGRVVLDASQSSDPDKDDLIYSWKQISGQKVDLRETDTASPYFFAPDTIQGVENLVFEVTVNDGIYNSDSTANSKVSVKVTNPLGTVLTVNKNSDVDDGECTLEHCTLREAINAANEIPNTMGRDEIRFKLPSNDKAITIGDHLPTITEPVFINGHSEPAFIDKPVVEVRGNSDTDGLIITSGNTIIKGLSITGFSRGIGFEGTVTRSGQVNPVKIILTHHLSTGNVIIGNYIGLSPDGTLNGNTRGIDISNSGFNLIGGTSPNVRNIISGNTFGIHISDGIYTEVARFDSGGNSIIETTYCNVVPSCASHDNLVTGNLIGTDVAGKNPVPNSEAGIVITESHENVVGSTEIEGKNIISGNSKEGIIITGRAAHDNKIQGNFIGTDIEGIQSLPNGGNGISLIAVDTRNDGGRYTSGGYRNIIGGTNIGEGNIISGNLQNGLLLEDGANANLIQGNYIGTDSQASFGIGNAQNGIQISNSSFTIIGTNHESSGNIISSNTQNGISIEKNSSATIVFNNAIGTDRSGQGTLGNHRDGVRLVDSSRNMIGVQFPTSIMINRNIGPFQSGGIVLNTQFSEEFENKIDIPFPFQVNTITNNVGNGVTVIGDSVNNTVQGNSIFDNGKLGIDLGDNGVTRNDNDDSDVGPNHLTNYPEADMYYNSKSNQSVIRFNITNAHPNASIVDIYTNDIADQSGSGEGKRYLGNWVPNSQGILQLVFNENIFDPANPDYGNKIFTATATDLERFGNERKAPPSTSEFSPPFRQIFVPIANAGIDQIVKPGMNVTLDGTNSSAFGASIASYSWKQIRGENDVFLQGSGLVKPSFVAPTDRPFALSFALTITDTNGLNDTDYVNIFDGVETDDDGDGIEVQVDTLPSEFSNDFNDDVLGGKTNGTIVSRIEQKILVCQDVNQCQIKSLKKNDIIITEETNPAGVRVRALATPVVQDLTNVASIPSGIITACNNTTQIGLRGGEDFVLTCGSVSLNMKEGEPSVNLFAKDGKSALLDLPKKNGIFFDPVTSLLRANDNNTETLIILVGDSYRFLSPGTSFYLSNELLALAGATDVVVEGSIGNILDGTLSLGDIDSYQWKQVLIADEPLVTITNNNNATAKFNAPMVDNDTKLTFELKLADSEGRNSSDRINVTVKNVVENINDYPLQYWLVSQWDPQLVGESPKTIAANSLTGDIYIGQYGSSLDNVTVQKLNSVGQLVSEVGSYGTSDGKFVPPIKMQLDPSGSIYIADNTGRIQKFSSGGSFIAKSVLPGHNNIAPFDVDTSGNVYVSDYRNDGQGQFTSHIQKFSSDGQLLDEWGSYCDLESTTELSEGCIDPDGFGPGKLGDGQFNVIKSIEIDHSNGVIYVADSNARVQKFSLEGQFVTKWGGLQTGVPDQILGNPIDIEVDLAGDVYVASDDLNTVAKFSPTGEFITRWVDQQHGIDAPLEAIQDNSVIPSGNIAYVIDGQTVKAFARFANHIPSLPTEDKNIYVRTLKDTALNFTVHPVDEDTSDRLFLLMETSPENGTVTRINQSTHTITYLPNSNFTGYDTFEYLVTDGLAKSDNGKVNINVNRAPISNAGPDKKVIERSSGIILDGSAKDLDSTNPLFEDSLTYSWKQLRLQSDPIVTLSSNDTDRAELDIPDVSKDTKLTFELTTTDSLGAQDSDTVDIFVRNFDSGLEHYSFLTKWGSMGASLGQFNSPNSVAFDSTANILYVVDTNNHRVQLFDVAGTAIREFGRFGSTNFCSFICFKSPSAVAVNQAGQAFIADTGNSDIKVLGNGGLQATWGSFGGGDGQFRSPSGVAIDSSGNVYVTDSNSQNNRVQKFTSTGEFITKWGTAGTGNGQFSSGPRGIAIDSLDNVYVSDGNSRIQKFTSTGQFISKLAITGQKFAIDENDNLYVFDLNNNAIRKFDNEGNIITSFGSGGSSDGQFQRVLGLSVDPKGDLVFIADTDNNRIQVFSKYPNHAPVANSQVVPTDINTPVTIGFNVSDPDIGDRLEFQILTPPENGTLDSIDPTMRTATYIPEINFTGTDKFVYRVRDGDSSSSLTSGNATVDLRIGLRPIANAGPDREVDETAEVVLDSSDSYAPSGRTLTSYLWVQTDGPQVTLNSTSTKMARFNAPDIPVVAKTTLTFKLVVTDNTGETSNDTVDIIVQNINEDKYSFFTKWGNFGDNRTGGGTFGFLGKGIAVDSVRDFVYVVDPDNNLVQKFDTFGNFITQWGSHELQLASPLDVAVSSLGNVYVTDAGNGPRQPVVQVFTPDGERFRQFEISAGTSIQGDRTFPEGIAIDDSRGYIYVVDSNHNEIQKFDSNGEFMKKWGSFGAAEGQFGRAYDIAIDPATGNVYVLDSEALFSPIQKFNADGQFLSGWEPLDEGYSQFGDVKSIAVDLDGNVYLTDADNNRIQKYTGSGEFITTIGESADCYFDPEQGEGQICPPRTGDGVLDFPNGLAVDSAGDVIYVLDINNFRVQAFAKEVSIPGNTAPVAQDTLVSTPRNKPVTIILNATDSDAADNNNITYSIIRAPSQGTLSAINNTSHNVTYSPNLNVYGNDSFVFKAVDSRGASDLGVATIIIGEKPAPPIVFAQNITTSEDVPVDIILRGSDVNNDTLTFYIMFDNATYVGHGRIRDEYWKNGTIFTMFGKPLITPINSTAAKVTYEPNDFIQSRGDFSGTDDFYFYAQDSFPFSQDGTSLPAKISITVKPYTKSYDKDEIFVSLSDGLRNPSRVQHFSSNGSLLDDLYSSKLTSGFYQKGGMLFDSTGNLLVSGTAVDPNTFNSGEKIIQFNPLGKQTGLFGDIPDKMFPKSFSVDRAGNFYIGEWYGRFDSQSETKALKLASDGTQLDNYTMPVQALAGPPGREFQRVPVWLDLAADQHTLYYSSYSNSIKRFDTSTKSPLPDLVCGLSNPVTALRLLPDYGVIVAAKQNILRLDANGTIIQTYDVPGRDDWDQLSIDNSAKSFWSADVKSANVYQFDMDSGQVLQRFDTGAPAFSISGLTVKDEFIAGLQNNPKSPIIQGCNTPPSVHGQNVTTDSNTALNVTLSGLDPNQDNLTFSIVTPPVYGNLSAILKKNSTTAVVKYTPIKGFNGTDSFSYKASDGVLESNTATVIVKIGPDDPSPNHKPLAFATHSTTTAGNSTLLRLIGTDQDRDVLSFGIVGNPQSGSLSSITQYQVLGSKINATQETPPNASGATGIASLEYNQSSKILTYSINHTGLTSPETGSHIHSGEPGIPGPIEFGLILGVNKTGQVGPLSAQQESQLIAGNLYINIHSSNYPDGEIRGQILPTGNAFSEVRYTPNPGFEGTDSFKYKVNDGEEDSNIANVTITVNEVAIKNTPPVAMNDIATTNEDNPILIPVLLNDTDVDTDTLTVDSISLQPKNGSSVVNANSSITYTPSDNFFGADTFNYTISDGRGGNATARVSVAVNSVNDPPITRNDIATTLQGKPVVINVLTNDTDPEGDALVILAITNPPSNGSAIINSNGTITFSPATRFSGSDTFDYQVSDGNGGNSTASVLVNIIEAANKPPVVTISTPINGSQFAEGDPVVFYGSATDREDGNISSVMAWESSIDGLLGIGPRIVTSSLSPGTHSITASAIDSGELSNSSRIEIIVNDHNEPPIAFTDHFSTNEDTPLNMNVLANDTDPENDALTIGAINQPSNGQANINNNNTINYSPNLNFNGQDSLTYTTTDGLGGNSSTQVIIDVVPVNDNPTAKDDNTATDKNTDAIIDVLANDTDVDNDQLTIGEVTTLAHGSAIIESSKIKYTPNLNFVGLDEFDYSASDGNGGNSQASVTVNVNSVNQLPVATDGSVNTDENTPLNMKLNASDPDNDLLTYILDTQPAHGSVSEFDGNNGTLTYTPLDNFTGQDSLKFKVNDGTADSNPATVIITVKKVNHQPVADNQNVVTNTNKQIEITLKGHDPDSDIITFVKVTDPSHGTIAGFDKDTGKLTYIPTNGFSGPDSFLFKVVDSKKAESNVATVSIAVNAIANKPPVASNMNAETNQNTPRVITLLGTDPDAGDKITYLIISPASSGSLSSIEQTTGKVTYTPLKGFLGADSFTYKVTDLSGASSNIASVGITVKSTTPTPYPLPPACLPNDKSGGKALKGSNSDDLIVGTEAGDSIEGLSGNDAINGCGAADNLNGNNGNDGIAGGTNSDNIHGNNGDDYLRGDAGDDGLYGGEGDDVFVGGPGRDSFYCGSGNDKVLDFNANEGDILQKDQTTRDRDPNKKHDCESVTSASSLSVSTKASAQGLPSTPTGQEQTSETGNQTKVAPSQLQKLPPPNQMRQNETIKEALNNPPTVSDYNINMDKNSRVSITLRGTDTDGDRLSFKIIDNSKNGLIKKSKSSGSLTYTPNKDYVGDDKFTFVASDRKSTSNLGTVTIHVNDKQSVTDQQQNELQQYEKQVEPYPLIYWRGNAEKIDKLLPLIIGNLTVDSVEKVNTVLRISTDNHNIYDNVAAQILVAKLNIKNEVNSCGKVNDALKYSDEVLNSVNYQGIGTVSKGLPNTIMKNLIQAHTTINQFNLHGCTILAPAGFDFAPKIFDILIINPQAIFLN